jgi:hypothetical protein
VSDPKHPAEQLLDLLLYTPLGFAVEARTLVPELADKGRQHFGTKVNVARMIGRFAVAKGQVEVQQAVQRLREQRLEREADERSAASERDRSATIPRAGGATDRGGSSDGRGGPGVAEPDVGEGDVEISVRFEDDVPEAEAPAPTSGQVSSPSPAAESLAIPDYDALSASQVVPRLPGLTAEELEAVRAYEVAGRGRKTILARVAQLQAPKG